MATDDDPNCSARILVVDDEPTNVRLLTLMLASGGYTNVRTTTDSREVRDLYTEWHPDLVLLDLHMPHLDGFTLLAQLQELIEPDDYQPFLVLTADATVRTRQRALGSGAHDLLVKPFDRVEVLLRIRNLLQTRRLHLEVQWHNSTLEERVRERTAELREALTQVAAAHQQVIQQERLHALGLMASGVAHDFNNALAIIIGFTDVVLHELKVSGTRPDLIPQLQTVVTAALDGAQMVSRLREFHRPAGGEETRSAVDLNLLVEQAVTLTGPKWKTQARGRGVEISVRTELGEIPPVAGDPAELREVLTNMIFNAVDAMPEGGTITLRTRVGATGTVLEIADTGTGMTEEVRRRCLEPFYTTKGDRGTGLGLAMVYGITERHGGSVAIESAPGEGTTFTFTLPAHLAVAGEEVVAPATAMRPLDVLVVDDQPVLCEVVAHYLELDLHRVAVAASGAQALAQMEQRKFDLVITDKAMPGMSGDQLAEEIHRLAPETRVIMLTGFGEAPGTVRASGIRAVLEKPVSVNDLRHALYSVMAE